MNNDQSVYFGFRFINSNSNTSSPSLFTETNQTGMWLPTARFGEAIKLKLVVHLNIIKDWNTYIYIPDKAWYDGWTWFLVKWQLSPHWCMKTELCKRFSCLHRTSGIMNSRSCGSSFEWLHWMRTEIHLCWCKPANSPCTWNRDEALPLLPMETINAPP